MVQPEDTYRRDLALVHHRGFGFHAQACAPGILALLEPIRSRAGIVLELGCGSGALTRELTAAGHRVIATDASPAMLDLARSHPPAAEEIRTLVLPRDPLPRADAVVSVGHVLSYLPDEHAIDQALTAIARALRPGGLLAIDICDLAYGKARHDAPPAARAVLKDLTRADLPRLVVLSRGEIPRDTPIEVLGSVVEEEAEAVTTYTTTSLEIM